MSDWRRQAHDGKRNAPLCAVGAFLHGLGITVCLENLRTGRASHPENVVAWARASGAMITCDVGHVVSCRRVQSGALTPLDVLEMFADRLWQVHLYEQDTDRHHPPRDMTVLGPIVDRLLATGCTWWTIELGDPAEALATRALLLEYLRQVRRGGYYPDLRRSRLGRSCVGRVGATHPKNH